MEHIRYHFIARAHLKHSSIFLGNGTLRLRHGSDTCSQPSATTAISVSSFHRRSHPEVGFPLRANSQWLNSIRRKLTEVQKLNMSRAIRGRTKSGYQRCPTLRTNTAMGVKLISSATSACFQSGSCK